MENTKIALIILGIFFLAIFFSKCYCKSKKQVTFKEPVVDSVKIIPSTVYPDTISKQLKQFSSKDNKSVYTDVTRYI